MVISIVWHFGYIANVWENGLLDRLPLYCGRFFFYDKDRVIECSLDDAAMFDMNVDCRFHVRKTVDLTRDEIFAVRCKGREDYSLYIPLSQVDLKEIGNKVKYSGDKTDRYVYTKYSITASNLHFWGNNTNSSSFVKKDDNSIVFTAFKGFNRTKKGKALDKLICDINDTCGLNLNHYDYEIMKILEHYDIVKKKSLKKA